MNTLLQGNNHAAENRETTFTGANHRLANQLELVKREVFDEYRNTLGGNEQLLRLALIEADALARRTEYPQLIFPLLAEEKARNAARWQFRQRFLLRSNPVEVLAA